MRFLLISGLCLFLAGILVLGIFAAELPDPREVVALKKKPAITILASDGSTLAHYGDLYGTTVTVKQLPR